MAVARNSDSRTFFGCVATSIERYIHRRNVRRTGKALRRDASY